jgi:hypothetical protein
VEWVRAIAFPRWGARNLHLADDAGRFRRHRLPWLSPSAGYGLIRQSIAPSGEPRPIPSVSPRWLRLAVSPASPTHRSVSKRLRRACAPQRIDCSPAVGGSPGDGNRAPPRSAQPLLDRGRPGQVRLRRSRKGGGRDVEQDARLRPLVYETEAPRSDLEGRSARLDCPSGHSRRSPPTDKSRRGTAQRPSNRSMVLNSGFSKWTNSTTRLSTR